MSLFSWMFTGRKPATPPESSGLSRMEPTRPAKRSADKDAALNNAQPANRKGERMARRELLYAVVRDAMTRAGVLSSGYKFKVLSLDARGRQFLVMVDLARNHGGETARLAEIEALIAQGAKARYDILVSAVYWRLNEHVAVGEPKAQVQQRPGNPQPVPMDVAARRNRFAAWSAGFGPRAAGSRPRAAQAFPLRPYPGRRGGGVQAGAGRRRGQPGRGRGRRSGRAAWRQRPCLRRLKPAWAAKLHAADRFRRHRTAGCPGSARLSGTQYGEACS